MGSNIIKILASKKWSQRKLAGASGLDPVYINRIINEKRDVRISTARKLAKALDCTIDDLFPPVELPEKTSDNLIAEHHEIT